MMWAFVWWMARSTEAADLRPGYHHLPTYRYGPKGAFSDTSGAVFDASTGTWHVWPLARGCFAHASTTDLVHWVEHPPVPTGTVLDDSGGVQAPRLSTITSRVP